MKKVNMKTTKKEMDEMFPATALVEKEIKKQRSYNLAKYIIDEMSDKNKVCADILNYNYYYKTDYDYETNNFKIIKTKNSFCEKGYLKLSRTTLLKFIELFTNFRSDIKNLILKNEKR